MKKTEKTETEVAQELKELQSVQDEQVKGISEEAKREIETEVEEKPVMAMSQNTVSLATLANTVTSLYCGVSDIVFKKIKKQEAPQWGGDIKAAISEQVAACLEGYNVPVDKPIYSLLITIAIAEGLRYSNLNNN